MAGAYYSGWGWDETFQAENDLSGKQFFCVEGGAAENQVDLVDAAADRAIGILQDKPKAGEPALVRLLGVSKAQSDGSGTAIAAWDDVGPDANGRLVKKATADYSVIGIALQPSTTLGAIIAVLLLGPRARRTLGG